MKYNEQRPQSQAHDPSQDIVPVIHSHEVSDVPQLSDEEIIGLKERLSLRTDLSMAPRVVSYIVTKLLAEAQTLNDTSAPSNRDSTVQRIGYLSAMWGMYLQSAINLPGSDWPANMTPPTTFADALRHIEADQMTR